VSQTTETISVPAPERPRKAAAIIGTAQTWKLAPWNDPSVEIFGLNDGYVLGHKMTGRWALPRMNGWYDLHPFSHMSFRPIDQKVVSAFDAPVGAYLRPAGHLEWLRAQQIPIWVNQKPLGWPDHIKEFPRKELEAKYGTYFTSTPSWMLVHLLEQGYNELHVYGIHLATNWEYQAQRPGFEFWLSHAINRGVKIVLPEKCPLLKSKHVYAYEPKPDLPLQAAQLETAKVKARGAQLQKQLAALKWYERGRRKDLESRLAVINLELQDARIAESRAQAVALA